MNIRFNNTNCRFKCIQKKFSEVYSGNAVVSLLLCILMALSIWVSPLVAYGSNESVKDDKKVNIVSVEGELETYSDEKAGIKLIEGIQVLNDIEVFEGIQVDETELHAGDNAGFIRLSTSNEKAKASNLSNSIDLSEMSIAVEENKRALEKNKSVEENKNSIQLENMHTRKSIEKTDSSSNKIRLANAGTYELEPYYDDTDKFIAVNTSDSLYTDIRTPSNWAVEDYKKGIKPSLYELIPTVMRMEKELGINGVYLISVCAVETLWGTELAGDYNYFNWSTTGEHYYDFDSLEEFTEYSINNYDKNYLTEDEYEANIGKTPCCVSLEVVNTKYAFNKNGTVNWYWADLISEIMYTVSCKRLGIEQLN